MAAKQWANTPFTLIETPSKTRDVKTSHSCVYCASEMAHAHNAMLRALNSIYLQAPFVHKSEDIRDLLLYGQMWYEWVEHHHHVEETILFPMIERLMGIEGLMGRNVEQHHAFNPGFHRFNDYVQNTKPEQYDAGVFRGIMDDFSALFREHLAAEIETLLALEKCDSKELRKQWAIAESSFKKGDVARLFPLALGAIDRTYEGGIHKTFPPVPFFVPYLVHYWYARSYAGVWRFSPCTTFMQPRPLMLLE